MDSNPPQRNQAPHPQHYFPGFEAVPPHLKVDPYKSPMMYESWPCNSNYGYSVPYHGCCNHGNLPGYYSFRPPCPHFAPQPCHHYPNYPPFPEPYPVYYVPPPHPQSEQPRYEYDKDAHHCCGCPNHAQHQKSDRSLKIEEQEPDAEKKEGDSVIPIQPRSYSYPIVWLPPDYVKNKENEKRSDQPEISNWEKSKPSKSLKPAQQEPRVWNGWLPLDMKDLKSLMQGEGERKTQNQQNEDKTRQLPFPIYWVPSDWKQEEGENQPKLKVKNASDHSKQAPVSFEFVPFQPPDNGVRMDKPQAKEDISGNTNASGMMGETANQKCVLEKQVQVHKEDRSGGTEKKVRDVSVKHIEETKKNERAKEKSPSPPKSSKLPPVCLRVDPLPKKRNGNGSQPKSPSTPKEQKQETLTKTSTAAGLKGNDAVKIQNLNGSPDKVEPGRKERKDIQVTEARSKEDKAGECTGASQVPVLRDLPTQEEATKPIIEKTVTDSNESKTESFKEVAGAEKEGETMETTNPDKSAQGQCRAAIKRISEAEAVKLIQSAYRGFAVRKREPLKKLKQIAKVREQVDEVRNRIQALESSFDSKKDDRQRLLIGEMIMSLLLKLDTIQGLHSSVRDARKSLAKELVTLQEKLDSLTSKQAEAKAKELAAAESADKNTSVEKENENVSAVNTSSLDSTSENKTNIKDSDQECLTHLVVEQVNDKDEETTKPLFVDKDLDRKTENSTTEAVCESEGHTAQGMQDGDVSLNFEHVTHPSSVPEEKSHAGSLEANDLSGEEKREVVEMNDQLLVSNNAEEDKVRSLPEEMIDQVHAVCESEERSGISEGEKELDLPINPTLPDEVENLRCINKEQEINLLEELPVGIIDEESTISEIEKCEVQETGETNTLPSTEGPLGRCQSDEQLPKAASDNCVKDREENESTKSPEIVEVEQIQEEEVSNGDKSESVSKPEEVPLTVGEENDDKVHEEEDDYVMIPVDHVASSESEAGSIATQEKEVLFEEKKAEEDQPVEVQEQERMDREEETTDTPQETAEEKVLVETDALPEPNVEQELLPASPASSQKVNDEHNLGETGGDNRLIEENRKLREMMEKLMEAGNNQLTVISNLTGRVKELEEKLSSRSKKSSKPRYKKIYASPKSRSMRVRGKGAEVAM
ncbi:hypothetical protein CCACVL1_21814 [Corchorus capsularis]|uniref:BAG domain-containing protein n=1 Tax=Corchorus capsularis TaxID=210143 RepID=A0A1R3H1Y4_COCAP|nr:hypothetical protein CCACVL1_21814 [Corchorus capsularis]